MKIIFCNVTYLNNYIGITDDDMPNKGGAWVIKNKDAHEQWNFLNYDGYCYGFVQNKGDYYSIERIDKSAAKKDSLDGVTVVWCALNDEGETVIVGWYENATVYRSLEKSVYTPIYGLERWYFAKAKAEDCYLLPEEYRTFVIGRASVDGKGKGFGQNNYWFAESSYAQDELIPEVSKFIEVYRKKRVNRIDNDFTFNGDFSIPLTEDDAGTAWDLYDQKSYFEFLPYAYRIFNKTQHADDAYYIADSLIELHQYKKAIPWLNKVIEIEGESWEINSLLPYLYQQCEMYKESTDAAINLFKFDEAQEAKVKIELYGIIADNYHYLCKDDTAIEWLNKILCECTDKELTEHTQKIKELWSTLL